MARWSTACRKVKAMRHGLTELRTKEAISAVRKTVKEYSITKMGISITATLKRISVTVKELTFGKMERNTRVRSVITNRTESEFSLFATGQYMKETS
jgi:hypothetical protein